MPRHDPLQLTSGAGRAGYFGSVRPTWRSQPGGRATRPPKAPDADEGLALARPEACDSAGSEAGGAPLSVLQLERPKPCGWQRPDVQHAALVTVGDKCYPAG